MRVCSSGTYEIQFLKRLEFHDPNDKNWDCVTDRPGCKVYKLRSEGSPVIIVKSYTYLPDIPNNVMAYFIRHIPTRFKW